MLPKNLPVTLMKERKVKRSHCVTFAANGTLTCVRRVLTRIFIISIRKVFRDINSFMMILLFVSLLNSTFGSNMHVRPSLMSLTSYVEWAMKAVWCHFDDRKNQWDENLIAFFTASNRSRIFQSALWAKQKASKFTFKIFDVLHQCHH